MLKDLPVTEINLGLIKTNLKPTLHAITGGRPFSKTLEAHAAVYFLGAVINPNI
jgi:hypothetical protein